MWEKSEMIPIEYKFWSPEFIERTLQKVNQDLWLTTNLVRMKKLWAVNILIQQWFEIIDQDCYYDDSIKSPLKKRRKQEEEEKGFQSDKSDFENSE